MTAIQVRYDFDVELFDVLGTDGTPVAAARTSTRGELTARAHSEGLINRLMADRHGVPFEHCVMSFKISAPLAVWREFMRHRHASYSEESARYRQLQPVFYTPPRDRLVVQVGKAMDYHFIAPTSDQFSRMSQALLDSYEHSYRHYESMLEGGIAREVARLVLPVAIYSTAIVTMNLRGLMNFLSLRVKAEGSHFPSNPQWEINQVANMMESHFRDEFPAISAAFDANGRVCP